MEFEIFGMEGIPHDDLLIHQNKHNKQNKRTKLNTEMDSSELDRQLSAFKQAVNAKNSTFQGTGHMYQSIDYNQSSNTPAGYFGNLQAPSFVPPPTIPMGVVPMTNQHG